MYLCFDSLISFEEKSTAKEMEYVTIEADICRYLLQIGDATNEFFSEETARTNLKYFKKCMYFCSSGLENPMFLSMAQDGLSLSEDILNIHRLMYLYCGEKHTYLKIDNKLDNIYSKYENCSFKWEVPNIFMPYLASYILAAYHIKNGGSIKSFFDKLKYFFDKTIEIKNEDLNVSDLNMADIYSEWTNEYLGQEYFSTLDTLYGRYSKTSKQEATVRNSLRGLTCILMDCPDHPSMIPSFATILLTHYKKWLFEKEPDNTTSYDKNTVLNDLTSFYAHEEPWKEDWEQAFLEQLRTELSNTTKKVIIFIDKYLKNNNKTPKYPLSVNDFNDFDEKCSFYLNELSNMSGNAEKKFRNFYKYITEERQEIRQAIENRTLLFDHENAEKHIKTLNKTILKYYGQMQNEFRKFIKRVEQSSSQIPENYKTLNPNDDYFKDLKKSIQLLQNHFSENLKIENEK